MSEQIRSDLEKRIHDRMREWVNDSMQLYDIGGISPERTMLDMCSVLMFALVVLLSRSEADADTIGHTVGDAVTTAIEKKRKLDSAES